MKILFISKEWVQINDSGLGISADIHFKILKDLKHKVETVSLNEKFTDYNLGLLNYKSFFKNPFSFINKVKNILDVSKPDLIVVEGLQTLISEIFLTLAFKKKIKTVLFSHGVSIFPYSQRIKYYLRFMLWSFYIPYLKFIMKNIDIFYSLDLDSKSPRHLDSQIRKNISNKKNLEYFNISRFNENIHLKFDNNNKKIVLLLGYINHIKNQKEIIKISKLTKDLDIVFRLVYSECDIRYKKELENLIKKNNLDNIQLIHHNETNIKEEINKSWILINVSLTEVMPLSLMEGMYFGKPFLSFKNGSIYKLNGGIENNDRKQLAHNLKSLYYSKKLYLNLSSAGEKQISETYNYSKLKWLIRKTLL